MIKDFVELAICVAALGQWYYAKEDAVVYASREILRGVDDEILKAADEFDQQPRGVS